MHRIILIVAALALLFTIAYWFNKLSSDKKKSILKITAFVLVVALLAGLAFTGRLNWIVALVGSIVPLIPKIISGLLKILPSLQPLFRRLNLSRGRKGFNSQPAQMETSYLRMILDQVTGEITGHILRGEFKGQPLKALSLEQLLGFLKQCMADDAESTAMLMAYLDRYFPGWRSHQGHANDKQQWQQQSEMTIEEACSILGVTEKASEKEILEAHKSLIQKMHPDRGGSDYLAAKINHAKDVLLKAKK